MSIIDLNSRAKSGIPGKGYRIYVPRVFENGDYILPRRQDSILRGIAFKGRINEQGRRRLFVRLSKDLGLSRKLSEVIAGRTLAEINRMEQCCHSVIDCLLLFDQTLFVKEVDYKFIKSLVRRTLAVASSSVGTIIKWWKEFTNFVLMTLTESKFKGNLSRNRQNFFFELWDYLKLPEWKGNLTKERLTKLAHLTSTRHFPNGDQRSTDKAINEFKVHMAKTEKVHPMLIEKFFRASFLIGKKCRKRYHKTLGPAHISLATSGSLERTVRKGGRGKEIVDAITPILSFVPTEEKTIVTPFIPLKDIPGLARWRTWCRTEPYLQFPEYPFGKPNPETLAGREVYIQGFDEALGIQIMSVAWLTYQAETGNDFQFIPTRVLAINEPGGKSRIVTTSPWWLYVLEQPVGHIMRQLVSLHPSASAGLTRSDQAWIYLRQLEKAKPALAKLPEFACLSSDLVASTDLIPRSILKVIYDGFLMGATFSGPLVEVNRTFVHWTRYCFFEDGSFCTTERGIFMGEPLTKALLTIYNLCVEEIAIRGYLKLDFTTPVHAPWRAFSVAGDDHIAVGPLDYLEWITATHLSAEAELSEGKHGCSKIAVRYCEKILDVRNILKDWTVKGINLSDDGYTNSPFVDSIKVRLISPSAKSNDTFNEKNTAIGKGKSLGGTLSWLNRTYFPMKWISMVRDRFFQRMSTLLPSRESGVYWHLLLPQHLGGLGLFLEEDLLDLCAKLPAPTKALCQDLASGSGSEVLKYFKPFTSNSSFRGYLIPDSDIQLAKELAKETLPCICEKKTLRELVTDFNLGELPIQQQLKKLKTKGWFREDEIQDLVLRPFLFKAILLDEAKSKAYNTAPLKKRYATLWDLTYRGDVNLSVEDLKKAINTKDFLPFYYIMQESEVEIQGIKRMVTLYEEITTGLPNLCIDNTYVGAFPMQH